MEIKLSKRLDGIGEYYFSKKLREIDEMNKAGKDVINLGIGSPDLPPHPDVIKVLQEESAKPTSHAYQSYKGSPVLRTAISDWYKKWYDVQLDPASEILPLIGSKEGIMHICMTYLNEGDKVLVPDPGYPTYSSAVRLAGGTCISYELLEENGYMPDLMEMDLTLDFSNVKLMFVNYPNMPTGEPGIKWWFEKIVSFAKHHNILIAHDNPYSFILNENPISMLSVDGYKEHVLELNSLSKSHNMAGWRVGMLCGAKERINEVLRFKSNMDSGMFLPIQIAAAKALSLEQDWYDDLNKVYKNRREAVFQLLLLLKCEFKIDQAGLFVWATIPVQYKDSYEFSDEILQNANVFITPGGIFGKAGRKYVRVSLCSAEEKISEAVERIQKLRL